MVYYGVVGFNVILVIIGLEGGETCCVGVAMIGGQFVLVTTVSSDGEASSVICVKLGYGLAQM